MEKMCAACHAVDNFVVGPDVTRYATVYACLNCGTLKIEKVKDEEDADSES